MARTWPAVLILSLATFLALAAWRVRNQPLEWLAVYWKGGIASLSEQQAVYRVARAAQLGDPGVQLLVAGLLDPRSRVHAAAADAVRHELPRWRSLSPAESAQRVARFVECLRSRVTEIPPAMLEDARGWVLDLVQWPLDGRATDVPQVIADCEYLLAAIDRRRQPISATPRFPTASETGPSSTVGDSAAADSPAAPRGPQGVSGGSGKRSGGRVLLMDGASPPAIGQGAQAEPLDANQTRAAGSGGIADERTMDEDTALRPLPTGIMAEIEDSERLAELAPWSRMSDVQVAEHLADARAETVLSAAAELRRRGYASRHIEALEGLMDASPQVRLQALQGLPALTAFESGPWLLRMTYDPADEVRRVAVAMLAASPDLQVRRRLRELETTERSRAVLQAVQQALRR